MAFEDRPMLQETIQSVVSAVDIGTGEGVEVRAGVDVVSVSRVRSALKTEGFAEYVFGRAEREYCSGCRHPARHYAARWAAKEAFLKAKPGTADEFRLSEIEVHRMDDGPELRVGLSAAEYRILDRTVSLAHDDTSGVALGFVVVVVDTSSHDPEESESR